MEIAKKSHLIIGIVVGVLFISGISFGTYYYLTAGTTKEAASVKVEASKTQEDKDLDNVKSDLDSSDKDLETTDLDQDLNDLNSIDLSGV